MNEVLYERPVDITMRNSFVRLTNKERKRAKKEKENANKSLNNTGLLRFTYRCASKVHVSRWSVRILDSFVSKIASSSMIETSGVKRTEWTRETISQADCSIKWPIWRWWCNRFRLKKNVFFVLCFFWTNGKISSEHDNNNNIEITVSREKKLKKENMFDCCVAVFFSSTILFVHDNNTLVKKTNGVWWRFRRNTSWIDSCSFVNVFWIFCLSSISWQRGYFFT